MTNQFNSESYNFKQYLLKIGDDAVAKTKVLNDPISIGKCSSEMLAANWFLNHYPATSDQVQIEISSIKHAAAVENSKDRMQVAEHYAHIMEQLFIIQEDFKKLVPNENEYRVKCDHCGNFVGYQGISDGLGNNFCSSECQNNYKYSRINLDQYFMEFARIASKRSTCLRRQEGAIAVQDTRIIATGFNGAPSGLPHCSDSGIGCIRTGVLSGENLGICRAVHAEENVIIQCAMYGPSIIGAKIYTTLQPCLGCAKSLVNSRVSEIIYEKDYPDKRGLEFLEESGIIVRKIIVA